MIWTQPVSLNEGEGGGAVGASGAGDAGGAIASGGSDAAVPMQDCPSMSQVAIDTEKVLGKCDHKHDGYMGKSCFHIPKKVIPTLHRWELCNGGSKRKKGKNGKDKKYAYEKGMKVITSYQDLVEALGDSSKTSFVFNIPHSKISEICDQESNDNSRFQKSEFMKLVGNDPNSSWTNEVEFVGLFDRSSKQCLALAALEYGVASNGQLPDDCYVNEIQSFKKGYGKALLKRILESQEKVWLCANPEAPKSLVDFYKQPDLELKEYVVEKSKWKGGAPAHFFYTADCDEVALTEFIDANYGQANVSESDAFDSMMTAMNAKKNDKPSSAGTDDDQFTVVPDADAFKEVKADDITAADDVFFSNDFGKKKVKHIYTVKITSMNSDDSLEFNDVLTSDKPLSFKDIIDWCWPKLPKGYGLGSKSFAEAGIEYTKKLAAAKESLAKTGSIEELQKVSQIPFPLIELSYGNTSRDMIKMTPLEHEFNDMTAKGVPAALVVSDNDPDMKFNKFATDQLYANQVIGESKNKITGHAKVILQKTQSLKVSTTSKPAKVQKVPLKKDAVEASQVSQSFKHVKKVSRPLQSKLMSKLSRQEKKHSRKVPELKEFSKPKLSMKSITFPRDEVKSLAERSTIVTTRVSDDYDKFQIGDIVKASQLKGKVLKVIARCNISKVADHPMLKELTSDQVNLLSQFDKMSVLTLAEVSE